MPLQQYGRERYLLGKQDPNSRIQIGVKIDGLPAGEFGKSPVGSEKDFFGMEEPINEPPSRIEPTTLANGAKTYYVNVSFPVPVSLDQEKAINDNGKAIKKIIYAEAAKLSGAKEHEIYYQFEIDGIQNASYDRGILTIIEAETALVKYKQAEDGNKLAQQKVFKITE